GAVYTPAAVIVPSAAFPPAIPFSVQVTVVSSELVTVAANRCEFPSSTETLDGATLTRPSPVGGWGVGAGDGEVCSDLPNPAPPATLKLIAIESGARSQAHAGTCRAALTVSAGSRCGRRRMPSQ